TFEYIEKKIFYRYLFHTVPFVRHGNDTKNADVCKTIWAALQKARRQHQKQRHDDERSDRGRDYTLARHRRISVETLGERERRGRRGRRRHDHHSHRELTAYTAEGMQSEAQRAYSHRHYHHFYAEGSV